MRLARRRATADDVKLFNSACLGLPYPLVVAGADGGLILVRGERLVSAAAAAGGKVEAEIFVATTPKETALSVLRASSTFTQAARNPIVRVDQVVTLRDGGLTAAQIAAETGYTRARISQLLAVAALAETGPSAWRAYRAEWISERTARYISLRTGRDPEAANKARQVIDQAARGPLATRSWRSALRADLAAALGDVPAPAATDSAPQTAPSGTPGPSGTPKATPQRRSTDLHRPIRRREAEPELFDLEQPDGRAPNTAA